MCMTTNNNRVVEFAFFIYFSPLTLQKHYHIDDLKLRLMQDAKRYDTFNPIKSNKRSFQDKEHIPPYIRKYNRRFKSIYESMHNDGEDENDRRDTRKKKKNVYGHFEKYQSHRDNNEIPESDILNEIMQKSRYHKSKQHHHKHRYHHHQHHNHHHQKIKKLRSKPEAGIMQKKLKT
jgi:hypothetical protein